MADSGTIGNRNSSPQIDDDDPLMELSRIIGLEPRRESVSRYAPAARVDPDFGAPVDAEPLDMPASLEAADNLQQDLAEELIASLESEEDFSALDAPDSAEPAAEFNTSGEDAVSAHDLQPASFAEKPVQHLEMPSSSPVQGSLEDELEAILNPEAGRHLPFGMRPLDAEPEKMMVQGEAFAGEALHAEAADNLPEAEAVMAFEEEAEPAEAAQDEVYVDTAMEAAPAAETSLDEEQMSAPETMEAEESDYWSRVARRTQNIPAYTPEIASDAVSEAHYQPEEPVEVAAVEDAPVAAVPQFEPLVDIIAHEARGVEMTGELDVPEFDYDAEEKPQDAAASGDDYDSDYAPSYQQQNGSAAPSMPAARYEDDNYDQIDEAIAEIEQERDYGGAGLGQAAAAGVAMAARQSQPRREFVLDDDDNFGASLDVPTAPAAARRASGRSYLMAAGLGAIALLGGIGAYALTRGGDSAASSAAAPVVLKADSTPVKVAPETPGGKVVPNQDIAVFDKAAGDKPAEAAQTELVSATEAPVDLAAKAAPRVVLPGPAKTDPALQEAEAAAPEAGAKSEERVAEQAAEDVSLVKTEVASVSPKKVRTMVVKSDGSLEERAAAPAESASAPDPVETALAAPNESAVPAKKVQTSAIVPDDAVGAVAKAAEPSAAKAEDVVTAAAAPEAVADPAAEAASAAAEAPPAEVKTVAVKPVKVKKVTQKAAKAEALREVAAANIPLVDGRPSDQPVTIVAKTGKTPQAAEEVAALAPEPAPAAGSYVIQIASAPSADAAQATYASLNRKFGNVIGGRNMRIQKADIPGKGTFYRVRIAAGSKKDAAALCAKYKSAGGQCLVAR